MNIIEKINTKVEEAIKSGKKEEVLSVYRWVDSLVQEYDGIPGEESWNIKEAAQAAKVKLADANTKLDLLLLS